MMSKPCVCLDDEPAKNDKASEVEENFGNACARGGNKVPLACTTY